MPEDTHFSGQRVSLLQWLILATLTLTSTLYAMSITIANIALPQLQGALAATQDQIAWTVTFNIVGTAIVTPMTGWLTTRFGQRHLMLTAVFGCRNILEWRNVNNLPSFSRSVWGAFSSTLTGYYFRCISKNLA